MKNNNIFSYLVELNQFIYISITIAGVLLLQLSVKAQILFENSDFEIGNNCDLEDCEDTDISCIPDWWNYYYPTEADEFAWVYYDDYLLCSTASLESCGGERGMKIYVSTSYEPLAPTTSNPFLGLNKFGAYEIHFQLNIIDNDCPSAIVEVYVDENEFDQTPNSDEFIADVTGTFNNN